MATPAFFNYEQYMTAKLAQVQNADPKAGWTMTKLMDTFTQNGFVGPDGAYAHFVQFGAAEEVAPNASFNANEYYAAKAAQFYGVEAKAVTEFQVASVKQIINSNGMNAWTHYQQFGSNEGVNPSNDFDAAAYLAAKATAMGGEWTAAKVADAIKGNGMTVLEHYLTYAGTGDTEVAKGATYPVADDKKVPSHNPGTTYNLTADIDNFTGTAGDDNFFGSATTTQAADQIDGGAGDDTFTFTGANKTDAATTVLPTMTNIENLVFKQNNTAHTDTDVLDLSAITGLKTVTLDKHDLSASGATTVALKLAGQSVTVKAPVMNDAGETIKFDSTADTALNLTVDGVKSTAGAMTFDVLGAKVATVDLTALNNESAFTLKGTAALKTLNIKGDAKVDVTESIATLATVNASENSAGVTFTSKADKAAFAFTGSKADDKLSLVDYSLANLDKVLPTITGGEGNDTLLLKLVNEASKSSTFFTTDAEKQLSITDKGYAQLDKMGFEDIRFDLNTVTTSTAAKGDVTNITVDAAKFQTVNTFGFYDSATVTNLAKTDTVVLAANDNNGAALTDVHTAGAYAFKLVADTDNTVNVKLDDSAWNTTVATASSKGVSIDASSVFTTLNLTGGDKGGAVFYDHQTGTAGVASQIVNASAFKGYLDVKMGDAADTITVGAGGSSVAGGKGADKITLGAGADTVVVSTAGDSTISAYDQITGFAAIAGDKADTLDMASSAAIMTTLTGWTVAKGIATKADATVADFLKAATEATGGTAGAVAFDDGTNTYVVYSDNVSTTTGDVVVELLGVHGAGLGTAAAADTIVIA